MTKIGFKIVFLVTICSVMFLTACNSTIIHNDGTALAKEKAYSIGSAFVEFGGSIPESDISIIDSWICEGFTVEVYNLGTKSESGAPDGNFLIAVIEIEDEDWRFLDMSPRFKALHQFTNEELSDYRVECKEIFLNAIKGDSSENSNNNINEDYKENVNNQEQSSTSQEKLTNSECFFFDGQRFECFETVSGEDIILTIRLFYDENSDIPSMYKGEMSNGVEFWFKPFEGESDYIDYIVDCADGTAAYIKCNGSELEFTADEGTEYGNMYAYSGTYIGLPDETEE